MSKKEISWAILFWGEGTLRLISVGIIQFNFTTHELSKFVRMMDRNQCNPALFRKSLISFHHLMSLVFRRKNHNDNSNIRLNWCAFVLCWQQFPSNYERNFRITQKPQNWLLNHQNSSLLFGYNRHKHVLRVHKMFVWQFNGICDRSCGMKSIWLSWFLNAVDCVIHAQTFMNLDYNECKKCNARYIKSRAQTKANQITIIHNDGRAKDEAKQ